MSDVTYGAKVPEELKAQLEQLQKESGLRTGKDFLQQMINCYVVEKTKESIPQVAEDLKELQALTQRINNIYLNLGYRIENITKAHEEELQDQLSKKDNIITGIQDKLSALESEKKALGNAYDDLVNKNNEYYQRVNELTESNNSIKELNEEYKSKVDTMAGLLKQYEKYPEQLEATKRLLSETNQKNVALESTIKNNKAAIDRLNEDITKLKENHEKEIAELDEKNAENVNYVLRKTEFEKEKAILKLQQEHQEEMQKINSERNSEIAEYQAKYKALLEELEHIKSSNKRTSKPVNLSE